MRIAAFALLALALAPPLRAQQATSIDLWLNDTRRASLVPLEEPYSAGPSIAAPVETKSRTKLGDGWTVVRGWRETGRIRVVVFSREAEKEIQIATRLLDVGASWEVEETSKSGAAPIKVVVRSGEP